MRIFLLVLLLLLTACGEKKLPEPVVLYQTEEVKILPAPEEHMLKDAPVIFVPDKAVKYAIDTTKVDEKKIPATPGHDKKKLVAIVTMPASSVPQQMEIYEDETSLREDLFPTREETASALHAVTTNTGAGLIVPTHTPWWYYFLGALAGAIATYMVGKKYYDIIAKPIAVIKKVCEVLHGFIR